MNQFERARARKADHALTGQRETERETAIDKRPDFAALCGRDDYRAGFGCRSANGKYLDAYHDEHARNPRPIVRVWDDPEPQLATHAGPDPFHVAHKAWKARRAARNNRPDRPTMHNTLADGVASALSFCREP